MSKRDMDKDMHRRAGVREVFGDLAKEMGFAVRDIRSEIVDSAWFNQDVSAQEKEAFEFYSMDRLSEKDQSALGARDFAKEREDLYGREDWDNVRDIEQDRHRDALRDAKWESEKAKADDLYGREHERDLER